MRTRQLGRRKLLVLGAGIQHLRIIRRARVLGYETHVVSIPGNYPGFAEADVSHYVDTTDIDAVVTLAKRLPAKAIVTGGPDMCVPTMGAVCDALGLPGISRKIAEIMTFKDRFRAFQKDRELPSPRLIAAETDDEFVKKARELQFPIVVKPSDSSASRGICRIEHFDRDTLRSSFEAALNHSRRRIVCAEEVLEGTEVGGNALLWRGRIVFLAITAKHMDGFIVRGNNYPTDASGKEQDAITTALGQYCRELGYGGGALNFDVMVNGHDVRIIELAARLGGIGLSNLIERAYGYDIETEMIRIAAGYPPRPTSGQCIGSCGSIVFGAPRTGLLRGMTTLKELQGTCPFVFDLVARRKVGDEVVAMRNNADLLGYALFNIIDGCTWQTCVNLICKNLGIQVSGVNRRQCQ